MSGFLNLLSENSLNNHLRTSLHKHIHFSEIEKKIHLFG